jgi:hypothetical protein
VGSSRHMLSLWGSLPESAVEQRCIFSSRACSRRRRNHAGFQSSLRARLSWLCSWLCRMVAVVVLSSFAVDQCLADRASDWQDCRSQDLDVNIVACTRLIEDPNSTGPDQREALTLRGFAYLSQNSFVSAERDFSNILKLEPGNVKALQGRAIAVFRRGDVGRAVLDYSLARRLNAAAVDALTRSNDVLKEIAAAAAQKPASQAELDELQKKFVKCQTGERQEGLTCVAMTCPAGQRLDGNNCVPIVCGTGYRLQGSACAAITCSAGQRLVGNDCVAIVCGTGYRLQGSACAAITCSTGQRLVGNDCQQISCGAGETLVGNDCVPNKQGYTAIALGKTTHLSYGVSWNQPTLAAAENDALARCRTRLPEGNCKIVVSGDTCVALAWTKTGTGWGAATRPTKGDAAALALSTCLRYNPSGDCISAGTFCGSQ